MEAIDAAGSFSVEARRDGAAGLVLLSGRPGRIIITGFSGTSLPDVVTDLRLTQCGAGAAVSSWNLACAEGAFAFEARAVEQQEPRPQLFDALLAPHALKPRERLTARCLLWLMRWPGGAGLLRAWHARRR